MWACRHKISMPTRCSFRQTVMTACVCAYSCRTCRRCLSILTSTCSAVCCGHAHVCTVYPPLWWCCVYVCVQDIARLTLAALRTDACENRTLTLAGPSAYTTREVIDMCAEMSDSNAQVTSVPTWLLRATRNILKGADWAKDAADRLVRVVVAACWMLQLVWLLLLLLCFVC